MTLCVNLFQQILLYEQYVLLFFKSMQKEFCIFYIFTFANN